jgi:hypothetical protein
MKKQNQKLIEFIRKLRANGANFNEAYMEVTEYAPDTDETIELVEKVYAEKTRESDDELIAA